MGRQQKLRQRTQGTQVNTTPHMHNGRQRRQDDRSRVSRCMSARRDVREVTRFSSQNNNQVLILFVCVSICFALL